MTDPQTAPESDPQTSSDVVAFRAYYTANPDVLPAEYEGDIERAVADFKSNRDMRAEVTRKQQEASDLRKQLEALRNPKPAGENPVDDDEPADPAPSTRDRLEIPKGPEPPTGENLWETAADEILESGGLSDATRKLLKEKYEVPDAIIDQHVATYQAQAQAVAREAETLVGGVEVLDSVLEFARTTLDEVEKAELNKSLSGPAWKTTLLGLKARMEAEKGPSAPKVPTVNAPPKGGAARPFANMQEQLVAMRDPRYQFDPEYREQVAARIRATSTTRVRK